MRNLLGRVVDLRQRCAGLRSSFLAKEVVAEASASTRSGPAYPPDCAVWSVGAASRRR